MPVEIRELIIKTEIISENLPKNQLFDDLQIEYLKKDIIEECIRAIRPKNSTGTFDR